MGKAVLLYNLSNSDTDCLLYSLVKSHCGNKYQENEKYLFSTSIKRLFTFLFSFKLYGLLNYNCKVKI